jgi:cysteine-rich repeat protein
MLTVAAVHQNLCVPNADTTACDGMADYATCTTFDGTPGACYPTTDGHACLPSGCGNAINDPGEACDDGNAIAGDGCSDSCMSTEICGNSIVDGTKNERCDDGNVYSHDGCSFDCLNAETPTWGQYQVGNVSDRSYTTMVYDSARHQDVMFGGNTLGLGVTYHTDTVLFDGFRFTRPAVLVSPPARYRAGAAYDARRGRAVMFGGAIFVPDMLPNTADVSFFNDTWEWDGGSWSQVVTTVAPPPRESAAMAYDPIHHRVVMMGGTSDTAKTAVVGMTDTWTYDGTTWSQLQGAGPSARSAAAMGFDPIKGTVILYGGLANDGTTNGKVLGDTWELDGATWTQRNPATSPEPRKDASLAFDAGHASSNDGLVLIAGQSTPAQPPATTWAWTGSDWQALPGSVPNLIDGAVAAAEPNGHMVVAEPGANYFTGSGASWISVNQGFKTPEKGQVVAFDSLRGRSVWFGGVQFFIGGTDSAATWELSGNGWFQMTPATSPPARRFAAMAFDEAHAVSVMFGGSNSVSNATPFGDTWTWNGTNWTQRPGTQPPARVHHMMAYDAAHGNVVLFGGVTGVTPLNDTWLWDGTTWTQATPASSPTARFDAGMAYDPIRKRVVMFGGVTTTTPEAFADTWEWDGTTWTLATPAASPLSRALGLMVWSPSRRAIVLFGGMSSPGTTINDTWEFDGEWHPIAIIDPPSGRAYAALTRAADGNGLWLVDGATSTDQGTIPTGELWRLDWGTKQFDDGCYDQTDVDHDGKKGCADNDCWATCTPLCGPGVDCPTTTPRCGDGICTAALETGHSCPQDCIVAIVCGDNECSAGESLASCPGDCTP